VATVLEGSVRKAGKRVRVAAQLINAADGYQLWSETYDRELDDIFAVQDDIAQAVVKELQANLFAEATLGSVDAAVKAASKGRTIDAEAYRLRMQGKYLFRIRAPKVPDAAIDYLRRALAIDPNFAGAWADLAHALYWRTASGGAEAATADYLAGFYEARAAAERAIALEPELPEAYLAMAYIEGSIDWNMEKSEQAIREALVLAPGDGDIAYHAAIHMLVRARYDEALALSQRAIELDPLNHNGYVILGRTHYCAGHLAEAEAALRKALEMNPSGHWGRGQLIQVLLAQHRIDEAARQVEAVPDEEYRHWNRVLLSWVQGKRDESTRLMLEVVEKYAAIFAYQIAQAHAFRGEIDLAFEWLDLCHEQHDPGAHWVLVDPIFTVLRADPRWVGLMDKLGYGYLAA
jgi:Tfp pilus assembly protein PilF